MHTPPRSGSGESRQCLNRLANPSLWRSLRTQLQPPEGSIAVGAEAITWIAGAAALRLGVDLLLLVLPWLWLPMAAVLLTPAAIAICLAMWAPPLSLLLGYRLCLIAVGLLIGG